jgi:5'-nucleotidase
MAKLLITNDDGIFARGMRSLVNALLEAGHAVMVVAPDRERSATSHALTLHEPLRVFPHEDLLTAGCQVAFSVSGTPVDCVKLAFNQLMPSPPDAVLSGINHGPNLGNDIVYSGTVSAAFEAALHGVPSVALSHTSGYKPTARFEGIADFVVEHLPDWLQLVLPARTILNINVPEPCTGKAWAKLSARLYNNYYDLRIDPRNHAYYWLDGALAETNDPEDTDTKTTLRGLAAITPVRYSLMDAALWDSVKGQRPEW